MASQLPPFHEFLPDDQGAIVIIVALNFIVITLIVSLIRVIIAVQRRLDFQLDDAAFAVSVVCAKLFYPANTDSRADVCCCCLCNFSKGGFCGTWNAPDYSKRWRSHQIFQGKPGSMLSSHSLTASAGLYGPNPGGHGYVCCKVIPCLSVQTYSTTSTYKFLRDAVAHSYLLRLITISFRISVPTSASMDL